MIVLMLVDCLLIAALYESISFYTKYTPSINHEALRYSSCLMSYRLNSSFSRAVVASRNNGFETICFWQHLYPDLSQHLPVWNASELFSFDMIGIYSE